MRASAQFDRGEARRPGAVHPGGAEVTACLLLGLCSLWVACAAQETGIDDAGASGEGGGAAATGTADGGAGAGGTDAAAGSGAPPEDDPTVESLSGNGPYGYESLLGQDRFNPEGFPIADSAFLSATLYYPIDAPTPFGAVTVCPGFTESQADIGWFGPLLASWGYAVLTMDTASSTDSPPQRALQLMAAIETLKAENDRSQSPLYGAIDASKLALMGHSMGGGGTLIAADANSSQLKAAIPITPYSGAVGGGAGTFPNITVPTLILAGQLDGIAPPALNALPFYQSIPSTTPKAYVELAGEPHGLANGSADGSCPSSSSFSGGCGAHHDIVGRLVVSWLKLFLDGDQRYRQFIADEPAFSSFDTTLD